VQIWIAHHEGLLHLGQLPRGVEVHAGTEPPEKVEFWVPPFLKDAPSFAAELPDLRVVQLLSAGADAWIGRLPPEITLCDARGVHSSSTSEWAITAMLAYLRDFPRFARAQAAGEWAYGATDELAGKRVLIVGAGAIGEALAARLAPFDTHVVRLARGARPGVHGVDELPRLLPEADIVVLIVPLTSSTTGLVDARFLARMKDGALLVNAARGPVVDTEALTAELATGRIGAALDVTDPEPLPAGHPLWAMPNVLLTPHVAGSVRGFLPRAYALVGAQLRRYVAGEPLANVVTGEY
jgi:phosphoglycerate dehydrogenase-like enzyme